MRRRITVDIEEEVLGSVDEMAARSGLSRNQWILQSVEKHLREIKRQFVDRAFLEMADDPLYQAEMARMEAEMAHLSDEAWLVMERAERAYGSAEEQKPSRRRKA